MLHVQDQFDLSALLNMEARRVTDTVEARSALLAGLLTNPQLMQYLRGNTSYVLNVAFSPDGKTLASGSGGTIILWDVVTRQPLGPPLKGHTLYVYSVAFSPDGKTLASGSGDNTIILWDVSATINTGVASAQLLGSPLKGHTNAVHSVAFSPDGKTLASGSADDTIILWDVATRQPLGQPLTGHTGTVSSVVFSPDGKTLASGSYDTTVILWDVSVESWQARACRIANRNLTQEEWGWYLPGQPYHKTCPNLPEGK